MGLIKKDEKNMWKIKLEEGQKLYVTSDSHYNHANICRGVSKWENSVDKTRPFDTLQKMNDTIIVNINERVCENDILLHMGDVSFGGFEYIEEFLDRVVCKNILLVLGNHDHHIKNNKNKIQSKFMDVAKTIDIEIIDSSGFIQSYELSHFPILSWDKMSRGKMHLFGHVHLPEDKKIMPGRAMDVGMDGNNYTPYSINEIYNILKSRPIKSSKIEDDHHETNEGR